MIHQIPIKYYSIAKQKITDKYYDLLSARISSEEFDKIFESFKKKMNLLDEVRKVVDTEETPYNRLISEVLFWGNSAIKSAIITRMSRTLDALDVKTGTKITK